jgi:NitT/TauT family transport system substrate-binding protein
MKQTTRRAVLAALAAAPVVTARPAFGQASDVIRIGAALDDQSTALLYGQHSGMFAKAGLNVEVQKFNSGAIVAAAVAGGSLEAGKAGTMAVITAFAKGLPFRLIAPVSNWSSAKPDSGIVVAANSPIRSAKDFNGKTVSVSALGDLYSYSAQAWFDQNGADGQSVKFVELPPPSVPAAIDQGRIDGGVVAEPLFSAAIGSGKYRLAAPIFDAVGKHWASAVIFARTDWIESHRSLVERFSRAVHDVNLYVSAHESEAEPLIVQYVGLDPAQVKKMIHPERPGYLEPTDVQPPIDIAAKYKGIPKSFPAADMISPAALRAPGR